MAIPKEVSEFMARKGAIGGKMRWQNVPEEERREIMRNIARRPRKKRKIDSA